MFIILNKFRNCPIFRPKLDILSNFNGIFNRKFKCTVLDPKIGSVHRPPIWENFIKIEINSNDFITNFDKILCFFLEFFFFFISYNYNLIVSIDSLENIFLVNFNFNKFMLRLLFDKLIFLLFYCNWKLKNWPTAIWASKMLSFLFSMGKWTFIVIIWNMASQFF